MSIPPALGRDCLPQLEPPAMHRQNPPNRAIIKSRSKVIDNPEYFAVFIKPCLDLALKNRDAVYMLFKSGI